jgi:hypothetical protein
MDGVLSLNEDHAQQGTEAMDEFHPELAALLDDPITRRVMASDKVSMASLLALLRTARGHLRATPEHRRAEPREPAIPAAPPPPAN